jgi:hypothetical protein
VEYSDCFSPSGVYSCPLSAVNHELALHCLVQASEGTPLGIDVVKLYPQNDISLGVIGNLLHDAAFGVLLGFSGDFTAEVRSFFAVADFIYGEVQRGASKIQISGIEGLEFILLTTVIVLLWQRLSVEDRTFRHLFDCATHRAFSVVDFSTQPSLQHDQMRAGHEQAAFALVSVWTQFQLTLDSFLHQRIANIFVQVIPSGRHGQRLVMRDC